MLTRQRSVVLGGALLCFVVVSWLTAAHQVPTPAERREAAQKANKAGNYKDAYEAARKLALDEKDDPL